MDDLKTKMDLLAKDLSRYKALQLQRATAKVDDTVKIIYWLSGADIGDES